MIAKSDRTSQAPGATRSRRWLKIALLLGFVAIVPAFVATANVWTLRSSRSRIYSAISTIPANDVALVLGSDPNSIFCRRRLEAGARLYKAGKVRHLLVSGDNHVKSYDEPTDMKDLLVAMGVPANCITCDYAGFRTLDSIVRAREVFGLTRFTIVSQAFHNPRALVIARSYGLDAVAFNAPDVRWRHRGVSLREVLARSVALLDLHVLHRSPRFLGPKEPIVAGMATDPLPVEKPLLSVGEK